MGLSANGREGRDRLQTVRSPWRLGVSQKQEALASGSEVSQCPEPPWGSPTSPLRALGTWILLGVFLNPLLSGAREEHWTRRRMGVFLCFPLLPAPRLRRVCFQVGSHYHLQVSDKPRQAPALSDSARWGREQGGSHAPTRVGSRTGVRSAFLVFRP